MTAGISASAMLGLKKSPDAARAAGNAASMMGSAFQWGQAAVGDPQAMAHHYLDKFRNINTSGVTNRWADKIKPNGDPS